MATVRKRKWECDGKTGVAFVLDYRDGQGRRRNKNFQSQRAAHEYRKRVEREIDAGVHTPASESPTIAEIAEIWLDKCETDGLERYTVKAYRQHVDLHLKPEIGAKRVAALRVPDVHKLADKLLKTRSRALVRKVLIDLGAMISEAQRRGLVGQNVAKGLKIRALKRCIAADRVQIPAKAELQTMIEKTEGQWRAFIVTAIFAGLRASELRGLTWSAIDLEGGYLSVTQRADQAGDIGAPKTAAGSRRITLAPMAKNTLREWKMATEYSADADFVFSNAAGGVQDYTNIVRRWFKPLQRACGIVAAGEDPESKTAAVKYGLHALRHAAASLWIEQGFNPKKVSELCGHASIKTTYDVYGHLFPDAASDHDAMAAIEARLVADAAKTLQI